MSKYSISILFLWLSLTLNAQQVNDSISKDTISAKNIPLRFRVGFDLGKFILAQVNDSQSVDFTIEGNYKNYFAVVEFGLETRNIKNSLLQYDAKGSYFRIGFDYDLYDNWPGMYNNITLGMRYGHASYDSHLYGYTINQPNNAWQPQWVSTNKSFEGLSANWIEVVSKVQVETFKNLYMGYSISLKYLLNYAQAEDFDVAYIPGFFKRNAYSNLGFGMQYIISYQFDF
jgi:hypothetical protein